MSAGALDRVPAPVRRLVAYTVVAVVLYAVLLAIGALFFPDSAAPGGGYSISATVAAGVAALYLVYLGGFARLRNLLR